MIDTEYCIWFDELARKLKRCSLRAALSQAARSDASAQSTVRVEPMCAAWERQAAICHNMRLSWAASRRYPDFCTSPPLHCGTMCSCWLHRTELVPHCIAHADAQLCIHGFAFTFAAVQLRVLTQAYAMIAVAMQGLRSCSKACSTTAGSRRTMPIQASRDTSSMART